MTARGGDVLVQGRDAKAAASLLARVFPRQLIGDGVRFLLRLPQRDAPMHPCHHKPSALTAHGQIIGVGLGDKLSPQIDVAPITCGSPLNWRIQ
jgi:hypothetical protein